MPKGEYLLDHHTCRNETSTSATHSLNYRLIVQSVMSSAETISNLPVCRVASNGDSDKAKRLSKFIDTKSSVVYRVASSLISTNILIGN